MLRKIVRIGVMGSVRAARGVWLASFLLTAGCGKLCDRDPNEPPVSYADGTVVNAGTPDATYETSGWPGPYLAFPPGRTYRITHGLGACPIKVDGYFAFDVLPVAGSNAGKQPSGSVPGGGNQFTIERVTPDTLDVRNDTCSDVRLRIVASDPDFTGAACTQLHQDAGNARPLPTPPDAATPPASSADAGP